MGELNGGGHVVIGRHTKKNSIGNNTKLLSLPYEKMRNTAHQEHTCICFTANVLVNQIEAEVLGMRGCY